MTWLLTRDRRSNFTLYCPSTYGMSTWGSDSQDSLEKKRKNWYICSWKAGNEWVDDDYYQYKINVVLETQDIDVIVRYLYEHNAKCQNIKEILDEARKIFCQYISFQQWELDR